MSWIRIPRGSLLALFVMVSCATAVDDDDGDVGATGGSVSGDGGGTATGGTTSASGGVFGAGGNLGGASSGGVFGIGGTSTGGAATGGTSTGGAATGGTATGGSDTGGSTSGGGTGGGATGDCADLPTYAQWKAGTGHATGDEVVFSCTKAQGSCAGRTVGSTHIFSCGDSHVPNCTSQSPDDGSAWDHESECP